MLIFGICLLHPSLFACGYVYLYGSSLGSITVEPSGPILLIIHNPYSFSSLHLPTWFTENYLARKFVVVLGSLKIP